MTAGPVGVEPYLPDECRRALEAWVCEDHPPGTAEGTGASRHIDGCPSCRELAAGIRLDQQLLRWQLGRIAPPPPRPLALRAPLAAASGHPRRVSLAVLPFLIAVALVLLLGVGLLLGRIGQGRRSGIERSEREAGVIERLAGRHLPRPDAPGELTPIDWPELLRSAAPAELESLESLRSHSGPFLDPWGQPYHLSAVPDGANGAARWRIHSSGPDRKDDRGAGDDVVAPRGE